MVSACKPGNYTALFRLRINIIIQPFLLNSSQNKRQLIAVIVVFILFPKKAFRFLKNNLMNAEVFQNFFCTRCFNNQQVNT